MTEIILKELNEYDFKNNNNASINYKLYKIYLNYQNVNIESKRPIFGNLYYSKSALEILNDEITIDLNDIYNIKMYKHWTFSFSTDIYIAEIIKDINNNNADILLITNTFSFVRILSQLNRDASHYVFRNEEYIDSAWESAKINQSKLFENITYIDNSSANIGITVGQKKRKNIVVGICTFLSSHVAPLYQLYKFPNLLYGVITALSNIEKGGNLYLITYDVIKPNTAFAELMEVLNRNFANYKQKKNNNFYFILNCFYNYTGTMNIIEKLTDIYYKYKKYNHTTGTIIEYMYYNDNIFYPINREEITTIPARRSIKILDSLGLDLAISDKTNQILSLYEYYYNDYFNTAIYVINKYIVPLSDKEIQYMYNMGNIGNVGNVDNIETIKKQKTTQHNSRSLKKSFKITNFKISQSNSVKKSSKRINIYENTEINNHFLNLIRDQVINYLNIAKHHNLPYQKEFLILIDKKKEKHANILNGLFEFKDPNVFRILENKNRSKQKTKYMEKIKNIKNMGNAINTIVIKEREYYEIDGDYYHNLFHLVDAARENSYKMLDAKKIQRIKNLVDNYSRGLARYINDTYKLKFNISNGFTKLWEIYMLNNGTESALLPNSDEIFVFHIAEAPGQWIYTTNYFYMQKKAAAKKYNWLANSLNGKHPDNIKKYGPNIISDTYGFIRTHKEKWLYGEDGTGDITNSANIKWFADKIRTIWNGKLNLITGDAGLGIDDIYLLQKLELAQVIMVLAVSSPRANCIIKHFLPYSKDRQTQKATTYYVNLMYLYRLHFEEMKIIKPLTSKNGSGEFYVVCNNFKGISPATLNSLYELLDNFHVNVCFIEAAMLNKYVVAQIINAFESLANINVNYVEIENLLLTCEITNNNVINERTNCMEYLNTDYVDNIYKRKYVEWIKKFKFQ